MSDEKSEAELVKIEIARLHEQDAEISASENEFLETLRADAMSDDKKDPNEGHPGYEEYEGKWRKVINGDRSGWWRFHDHYDRNGYCDNPARGY